MRVVRKRRLQVDLTPSVGLLAEKYSLIEQQEKKKRDNNNKNK